MTELPPLPPLPDGLDNPDVDLRINDLRDADFDGPDEMIKRIVRNVDKELDTLGWDRPDWLAAIHTGKTSDTDTSFVWIAPMTVPEPLHGDLARSLPFLATMLSAPLPGVRERVVKLALGDQPADSVPIGAVVAFECWGVDGTGPVRPDVIEAIKRGELDKHPDATEQRHVVARMFDGMLLHLVHVRDREPVFVDDPGGTLPDLLAVITDAICGLPTAPPPSLN